MNNDVVRYVGEVGDVVIGRITEVGNKRWKVDAHAMLDSALMLSCVNLPGGELVCTQTYKTLAHLHRFSQTMMQ